MVQSTRLPFLKIQSDWDIVIREAQGNSVARADSKFWVSSYGPSTEGVYGRMDVFKEEAGVPMSIKADDSKEYKTREFEVEFPDTSYSYMRISCESTGARSVVHAPSHRWDSIHPEGEHGVRHILSLDICDEDQQGVSASTDGMLRVWDTSSGAPSRDLKGHIGDVNLARWFPKGKVVLSAGSDLTVKIWSAELGRCAKTLKGHSRSVTGAGFIGSGKNFVTCGKDGTVKYWDCGQGLVSSHLNFIDPINDVMVIEDQGPVVAVCAEDGRLVIQDLREANYSAVFSALSPINTVAQVAASGVVIGTQEGDVSLLDLRSLDKELSSFSKSEAPIFRVHECSKEMVTAATAGSNPKAEAHVWVTNGEGDCSLLKQTSEEGEVVAELTGVDCEPVYDVGLSSLNCVYTASRGCVMRYSLAKS